MKKLFFTLAVVLIAQLALAQSALEIDVQKVIQMTGSAAQADIAKKQIITMIPEAKQAEFSKEFDAILPIYFSSLEKFYMENYTHEEIKQIIKFYESPVGEKITANAEKLTEATMKAAQEWGDKLQSLMMKYMQ